MIQGLAIAVLATALMAAVGWLVHGREAAVLAVELLLPLGVVSVLATVAVCRHRDRFGSLRRQFAALALLAAAVMAGGVLVFVLEMFVSPHDALYGGLLVLWVAVIAAWAARLLGARALADLDRIRRTLARVGQGQRDVRAAVQGTDEIAALGADVDRMIERLEATETARRNLLAAVSHDLRTPITSLRLLADALEDDIVEPEGRQQYVRRMTTHVQALSALIDDLFELTRLEAGDLRWSAEQVALDELVGETVDAMRPQAAARGVDVQADLVPELAAHGDPERLQRVLFNLIQNAIRHTPADGSVVVRAHPAGDMGVEIEVADTGEGIAPEDRPRVFEAFFQGGDRAARGDRDGAGLGLAVARAIVEAHGGRIWLEDGEPGTRVRFSIPARAGALG